MHNNSNSFKDHLYVLIAVGGGGTRLWPRSRNKTPKQFLKLFKGETLFQYTAKRFGKHIPWEKIFAITTSEDYKKEMLSSVPKFHKENILVEPARRDTGPAYALGASYIQKRDKDAVIINSHSDHILKPDKKYIETAMVSAEVAWESGMLIAVGVKPTRPHTGLGHIKLGKNIGKKKGRNIYKLEKFVEKPDLARAKMFTESGEYIWNTGQYVWRADSILASYQKYAKDIYKQIELISKAIGTSNEKRILTTSYNKMPKVSVDYAISEKATNFLTLIGDYEWQDLGDWEDVYKRLEKDKDGNVIIDGDEPGGEIINIDTTNALIHKDGRLIALVDVDDLIIVDTKDALLIAKKSEAQNVKKIVEQLKTEGRNELL